MKNKKTAILLALITALISAVSITYNKFIVVSGIDPLIFNIIKNGGVGIVLTLLLFTKRPHTLTKKTPKKWASLITIGIIGGSIPFVLFFEGLRTTPSLTANFIHKTMFLWVALLAITFLKEKVSFRNLGGYLLIVIGAFFIMGIPSVSWLGNEKLILAATILWAIEFVIAKKIMKTEDATTVAWARMFFGSIVLIVLALSQQKLGLLLSLEPSQIIPIIGSIALLTLYVFTWYHALKRAPATLVATVLTLATPIAAIITSSQITPPLILTTLISAAGVMIFLKYTPTKTKS